MNKIFRRLPRKRTHWIRSVRSALFLSVTTAAARLGLSAAAFRALEKREADRQLTLAELSRVAQAFDCEVRGVFIADDFKAKSRLARKNLEEAAGPR